MHHTPTATTKKKGDNHIDSFFIKQKQRPQGLVTVVDSAQACCCTACEELRCRKMKEKKSDAFFYIKKQKTKLEGWRERERKSGKVALGKYTEDVKAIYK